jgi:hypothetical protein
MHNPNHGYQQHQLQPQNSWPPEYQNQYQKYEQIEPMTNHSYQPVEYIRDYDLNGYHPNDCHGNDYYIYPEETGHQSHGSYQSYAQPIHNGYQKHIAVNNQPKNQESFEYPVQGQPVQGQPVQGQPVQGQPVQGQPVQGQPVQGQPVQGQPFQGQIYQGNAHQNYVCHESTAQYPWNMGESHKYSKWEAKGCSLIAIPQSGYGSKTNYDDYGYLYDQQYDKTSDAALDQNIG